MRCLIAILACVTLIGLVGSAAGAVESEDDGTNGNSRLAGVGKEKEEIYDEYDYEGDEDDEADAVYDEKQIDGETNIRLHIKNFQIQVPESSLDAFKKSDMATMIRNSILKLFGIPYEDSAESAPEQPDPQQPEPNPDNSMLQVNGNDLPAKFFLEISDFLMNNHDNDAVDDKRVETNHRKNAEIYATEEIKIERLENVNNVKNETITISKKRYSASPANVTSLAVTNSTEHNFRNNVTHNRTEAEDRFQQTRPIKLEDGPVGKPMRLREKVIWRMEDDDDAN